MTDQYRDTQQRHSGTTYGLEAHDSVRLVKLVFLLAGGRIALQTPGSQREQQHAIAPKKEVCAGKRGINAGGEEEPSTCPNQEERVPSHVVRSLAVGELGTA